MLAIVGVAVLALLLVAALTRSPNRDTAGNGVPTPSQGAGSSTAAADDQPSLSDLARRIPGDPLAIGRVDARVVMVEYSDFRCPFCGVFARETMPALRPLVDDGTLRIEYRDMPIFGKESQTAALAGRAAAAQGKFWEFYHALSAEAPERGHASLPLPELQRLATKAGVPDLDAFTRAMESQQDADKVQADTNEGYQIGVSATPAFLINDTPILGAQPTEVFLQTVQQEAR